MERAQEYPNKFVHVSQVNINAANFSPSGVSHCPWEMLV